MTSILVDILISLSGLLIGLGWGMRFFGQIRKGKMRAGPSLFLVLVGFYVCLIVILLHAPHVRTFPLLWRMHGLNATWLIMRTLLLGACGVAIALSWRSARHQVVTIALVGAVGAGGFWGLEHYLMAPIYPSLNPLPSVRSVVQQTSESSCAPAALATVLKQWQIQTSEAEVAKLAQTSRMGTSMPHLIFAVQQLGLEGVDLKPSWETMRRINRPGILSIWVKDGDRRLPHAVALLSMNDESAIIADPASGEAFRLSRKELEKIWRHEYVPIFQAMDMALSKGQALNYLIQSNMMDAPAHQSHLAQHNRPALRNLLHHFQEINRLRPSGQLDPSTVLALRGPFLEHGPTLANSMTHPMTMSDYHHLPS